MNNKNSLTLGSLFSGSGGFELAGTMAGIEPKWNSEIEPFAIAVTNNRFPNVKHYGDISELNGNEIEPVDIITFGSPCQNLSLAGNRSGLSGAKSSLFFEAIRVIKEMRCATNGKYPRWIVWENVPGAFSSNKGKDFKAVLVSICGIKDKTASVPEPPTGKWTNAGEIMGNGYSVAWRVLDAQHHGVPQRRKRIFLIADFNGGSAGKILFESKSLPWHTPQSICPRQASAGGVGEGAETSSELCLNDQGGQRIDITNDVTATLRAKANHPPCVMYSARFCAEHSEHSRGIGCKEEISPTLRAKTVPAALFENHSQDTRYTGPINIAQTVSATYGMGGNNQPFVLETPKTLKIRSGCDGGGKGALIQDDKSATLGCSNDQTVFVPKVYGICSNASNSMKSNNPNSGIYEAETARTLDGNGGNPICNQGGMAVVEGSGARPSHNGNGYRESDIMYTLNTVERHGIAYGIDRAAYNMGENAQFGITVKEDIEPTIIAKGPGDVALPTYSTSKSSYHTIAEKWIANTLVATDYKDPPSVTEEPYYIVRRLTPTECARLQGFPDWWCGDLGIEEPTEEDLKFWRDVFETHRRAVTGASKPKTDKQIIKWLKNPHSDSAEYRLWGNGVALPCVYYIMNGIADYYRSL